MQKLSLILVTSLLLSGCVASQNSQRLEQDVQRLKLEIRELKTEMKQLSRLNQLDVARQIETLGRQQAELQAGVDTLKVESQSLRGRVDDQMRRGDQQVEEVNLSVEDISLRMSALEEKMLHFESTREQEGLSLPAAGISVGGSVAAGAVGSDPGEAYRLGVDQVRNNDFDKGMATLEAFLANHPEHALKINAQYWIGEALYGKQEYEKAIIRFQDIISLHEGHPKVPSAILKQGLSFYALQDKMNAKLLLQKVTQDYEGSPEAEKAKKRLESWQ